MELLFLFFKIILIVLLAVTGLVLLLVGIILFVPIRYEISGKVTDAKELALKGKITYCLSILKLIVSYQNGQTDFQIYLFGFQKKEKQAEQTSETTIEEIEQRETVFSNEGNDTEEEIIQEEVIQEEIPPEESLSGEASSEETLSDEGFFPKEEDEAFKTDAKPNKKRKRKRKAETTERKFDFAFIKQQLTDEHNHSVVKKLFGELGYLLKHFKFRKIKTDLGFSAGDPALTGQILGVLCMIPVLYQYEFRLVPDFETEELYIKGSFLVAGKIRLVHGLVSVLRSILDKEIRMVAKKMLSMLK